MGFPWLYPSDLSVQCRVLCEVIDDIYVVTVVLVLSKGPRNCGQLEIKQREGEARVSANQNLHDTLLRTPREGLLMMSGFHIIHCLVGC